MCILYDICNNIRNKFIPQKILGNFSTLVQIIAWFILSYINKERIPDNCQKML